MSNKLYCAICGALITTIFSANNIYPMICRECEINHPHIEVKATVVNLPIIKVISEYAVSSSSSSSSSSTASTTTLLP